MLDFKEQNDKERAYYNQDFSPMNEVFKRVRHSLITGSVLRIDDIDLSGILKFKEMETLVYLTLFQAGNKFLRWGCKRSTFVETLIRNIAMIRKNERFADFNVEDENLCRIMIEFTIDRKKVNKADLRTQNFTDSRFEIGINGLELRNNGNSCYYMPTDAVVNSHIVLTSVLQKLVRKTPIAKLTRKNSERLSILNSSTEYDYYLFKSRAIITYKDSCFPLYRGNIRYTEFNRDTLYNQIVKSANWLVENMYEDGRFLYYYECMDDNFKDHEHPERPLDDLYYNDLRHCGGIIALLRTYQLTGDEKFIRNAKRALDWSLTISRPHDTQWGTALYAHYNHKGKLGGTGVLLVAAMQYRIITGDKSYDEFIKSYVRHILSRVCDSGELLGYYINPKYQKGQPLISMTDEERKEMFSFYYPGEALLGLGLFVNNFEDDEYLVSETKRLGEKALDWIIEERPKVYADLFTALPSDAWLMQAIEEWAKNEHFRKENYINFVFKDADTMVSKTYTRDNSPYIDYEGGYYYEYGDHYYPDGARSEGLVAAYYLAKFLGKDELAEKYLQACKKVATCQFHLFNCELNNYSHKNPERSKNSIRFKATRQWVRVDSIQHVGCFFSRLYMAE